jgi:hypothetical protein
VDDLAAQGHEGSAAFFVVVAGVAGFVVVGSAFAVDVELVAFEGVLGVLQESAAVVDAAVAFAGDAVLEFEFEVFGDAGPDEEGVAFDFVAQGDFADDGIFSCPEFGVAVQPWRVWPSKMGSKRFRRRGRWGRLLGEQRNRMEIRARQTIR